MVNVYAWVYIYVNYRIFHLLGSSRDGSEVWTEFRTYISLSNRCPRHLLAFWYYGNFVVSGQIPYLDLMSISYDQMNSSGVDMHRGRFRGEHSFMGKLIPFPISPHSHILGGVLFTNVCTVSNRDTGIPLFEFFNRLPVLASASWSGKIDRTNIAIDFGVGNMSTGLYLQTQEVF